MEAIKSTYQEPKGVVHLNGQAPNGVVRLNGQEPKPFLSEKSVKQRDSPSPLLFIMLIVEVLEISKREHPLLFTPFTTSQSWHKHLSLRTI